MRIKAAGPLALERRMLVSLIRQTKITEIDPSLGEAKARSGAVSTGLATSDLPSGQYNLQSLHWP